MKLIDAVVPQGDLIKAAKDWIKSGGAAKAPWDVDGFKLPGGPVYSKAGMMVFPPANAIYRRETYDNYPAARAIMQVVYEGLQLPIDQALRVESRWFAKILRSPEAAAMIRSLFVSMQELNKGARRPAVPAKPLKKIGVLGAGFMGGGIAYVSALAGLEVVLIDRDPETAEKGKAHSQKLMTDQVNRGRATTADRETVLARIHPTADYVELKDCDLVVEAVFEDRKVKEEVISRAQNVLGDEGDLRLQHFDTADLFAGGRVQGSRPLHRHPFFLAGRTHDAGRDHHGQGNRRHGARHRARLRARHPQNADRRQRFARLLYVTGGRHLYPRRSFDADRGRAGGDDRECRAHGRHAGRTAGAHRRGRRRPGLENPQSHRGRSRRQDDRSQAEGAARGDGGKARTLRPQERQRLL